MRGFSFIIVMIFILSTIPVLALQYKTAEKANRLQDEFVRAQSIKNTQEDIVRTLSEVAKECERAKDEKLCGVYFKEWETYWGSRDFEIVSGEITYKGNIPHIVRKVKPVFYKGVLRPDGNVSNFGIILKRGRNIFVLPRGDYT